MFFCIFLSLCDFSLFFCVWSSLVYVFVIISTLVEIFSHVYSVSRYFHIFFFGFFHICHHFFVFVVIFSFFVTLSLFVAVLSVFSLLAELGSGSGSSCLLSSACPIIHPTVQVLLGE